MNQIPLNYNSTEQVMIINPDGRVHYEPNVRYQQPTIIRRSYRTPPKPKYRYMIEQEGKSYRCCQWCRYWCTRKCPICDFCDRIISCPMLCCILSALFLLLLLTALLTLFGLHPDINASRRYYGIISTLSIVNQTKYIYGMDQLCNQSGQAGLCLNITTSTAYSYLATTILVSRIGTTINYSYILIACSSIIYYMHRKIYSSFL